MKEALFYSASGDGTVRCRLCPHECIIGENQSGICRQRKNRKGVLIAEGYGHISAIGIDPIEKKPLYHFHPGKKIFSVGGLGCNFSCPFCQNWQIAHRKRQTIYMSPDQLIERAVMEDSFGIAFTYNEPTVWYEYIYDTARIAHQKGIKIVLVTNGYINPGALKKLLPVTDAMNIDVKAYNRDFYRKICRGRLDPVKQTVEIAAQQCHVEVTSLVIGGLNDGLEDMEGLFNWLAAIDINMPLHLSRYFPNYQMFAPPTSIDTLNCLREAAQGYLNYVYIGNVFGSDNNTYCPNCRNLLVDRVAGVRLKGMDRNRCNKCNQFVPIVL